jgi:hypothetical protein
MRSNLKLGSTVVFLLALLHGTTVFAALRSHTGAFRPHAPARIARTTTSRAHSSHAGKAKRTRSTKPRSHGQQSIDPARLLDIQRALIRENYLQGEPTGEWDTATREALLRLQDENHWQTKIVPDARALIKLGLGPSQQNLLNPESAAMASAKPGPAPQSNSN